MRTMRMKWWLVGIMLTTMLGAPLLQAQWVMVARAASKRVKSMKQTDANGNGYDVATVLLEAPAEKVFETALTDISKHEGVKITKVDAPNYTVQFTNGKQSASLMATSLGPKATDLVVATTVSADHTSATWQVVDGVLNVCKQMNVECKVGD
jgi:hypothetical protein